MEAEKLTVEAANRLEFVVGVKSFTFTLSIVEANSLLVPHNINRKA